MTSRTPVVYTPATEMEQRALKWLATWVRFPPGTSSKRFARELCGVKELSDRQRAFLWRIVYRFRRQIHPEIVAEALRLKTWAEGEGRGHGRQEAVPDVRPAGGAVEASSNLLEVPAPDSEGPQVAHRELQDSAPRLF